MRIQHNITALNAANRLKSNESTVAKNIQKLSSGYRINSAADDAAGLAVSEKMRKQINGLSQAEDNTQNGISLIQTAEGGLNETSAILQRMNTLAVEASNGTYKDADRKNLQMEVDSLNTEVNRISTATKFNEISLLDGSLSAAGGAAASSVTVAGLTTTSTAAVAADVTAAAVSTLANSGDKQTYQIGYKDAAGNSSTFTVTMTYTTFMVGAATQGKISIDGVSDTAATDTNGALKAVDVADALVKALKANADTNKAFAFSEASGSLDFTSKTAGADKESVIGVVEINNAGDHKGLSLTKVANGADGFDSANVQTAGESVYDGTAATKASAVFTVNGQKFAYVATGKNATDLGSDVNAVYTSAANAAALTNADANAMSSMINDKTGLASSVKSGTQTIDFKTGASSLNGNALVFQVGAENTDDQRASLSIGNMNAASLGLTAINISNPDGAKAAIDIVSKASASVSTARAQLGALQNELEHTANNLSTMNENLTSAESTIRDVDMTNEYVQFSKNQILTQAANSMLAQANAQPQNVLSLLKG